MIFLKLFFTFNVNVQFHVKKYSVTVLFVAMIEPKGKGHFWCENGEGAKIHVKQADYICHQYVKAALLGGYVNLSTGLPTHTESAFVNFSTVEVANDPDFIRVCSSDAKAVVPIWGQYGHSAILLTDGSFASTPSASTDHIFKHTNPRAFTTGCDQKYYAPIPQINISGVSSVNQGTQFTLTLTNGGQPFPSFIQLSDSRWEYNTTHFTFVTKSSTSITLIANSFTGYSEIKYRLVTGCNGDNFFRTKTIQVLPNCTGTLNGASLNTFNMVSTGPNQVVMHLNSWTWVRTSGSASWSTSNGGKNMTFTISSGCSTFNAYNASCNLTITFCKGSSFSTYTVMDMKTLGVIKEGMVKDDDMNTILDELPAGNYVINIDGNTSRYVKSN